MLSQNLFLLREFTRRDFKGRYAGSMFGLLWPFAQPLWELAMFTFIFSTVLKISPLGERTDNFAVFLFCGLLPWTAVYQGVFRASTAITDNANLVKKVNFPSELLVFSVVAAAILHEAIAMALFIVVLIFIGSFSWSGLWLLVLTIPLQLALTVGLGLMLGAINVFFRDISQLLSMLLMGWFYVTPIVYPLGLLPDHLREIIELNPLATLVFLYREALLGGSSIPLFNMVQLVLYSATALGVGLWLFRRLKPAFVDDL